METQTHGSASRFYRNSISCLYTLVFHISDNACSYSFCIIVLPCSKSLCSCSLLLSHACVCSLFPLPNSLKIFLRTASLPFFYHITVPILCLAPPSMRLMGDVKISMVLVLPRVRRLNNKAIEILLDLLGSLEKLLVLTREG